MADGIAAPRDEPSFYECARWSLRLAPHSGAAPRSRDSFQPVSVAVLRHDPETGWLGWTRRAAMLPPKGAVLPRSYRAAKGACAQGHSAASWVGYRRSSAWRGPLHRPFDRGPAQAVR